MSTVCVRPQGEGGSGPCGRMWTGGRGLKNVIFCGSHKWMAPTCNHSVDVVYQIEYQNENIITRQLRWHPYSIYLYNIQRKACTWAHQWRHATHWSVSLTIEAEGVMAMSSSIISPHLSYMFPKRCL